MRGQEHVCRKLVIVTAPASSSPPGLPDILQPGLRLVFVGYNPSLAASKVGHYYAGKQNFFYRVLHLSGLTPRLFSFEEDLLLPDYGIGMTDLCPLPTAQVSHLPAGALRAGRSVLREKLERYQPATVCFNGFGVYQTLFGKRIETFGPQPDRIGESQVFVVPSTSPANNGLMHQREEAFIALAAFVGVRK